MVCIFCLLCSVAVVVVSGENVRDHRTRLLQQLTSLGRRPDGADQSSSIRGHFLHPVQELEYGRDLQDADEVKPIRIKFVTEPLERRRTAETSNEIDYIINVVLPQVQATWSAFLYVNPTQAPIAYNASDCLGIFQPGDLDEEGLVFDADLVIVVGGYDSVDMYDPTTDSVTEVDFCVAEEVLALAYACSIDQRERPILGYINFCLQRKAITGGNATFEAFFQREFSSYLQFDVADDHVAHDVVEVAIHESGHILAVAFELYKYFREADGTPRTPRPFAPETRQCPNGIEETNFFPAEDVVAWDGASWRFSTPRVKQVVQNHFNCAELSGARLELSEIACIGSHWHEREYFGELMGPVFANSGQNVLSALTLAMLEDSGFYRVNYLGVPTPAYGAGAGCEFVTQSCIVGDAVPSYGAGAFCDTPVSFANPAQLSFATLNSATCDPSHRFWTICDLYDLSSVPYIFEAQPDVYFSDPNLVVRSNGVDACPMPQLSLGLDCTIDDGAFQPFLPGETAGPDSRCFVSSYAVEGISFSRPSCFRVVCDASAGQVSIRVEGTEYPCTTEGETISVTTSQLGLVSITCPRPVAVCPELFSCPAECSGRGSCVHNGASAFCNCFENEGSPGCFPDFPDRTSAPTQTTAPSKKPTFGPSPSPTRIPVTDSPTTRTTPLPSPPPSDGEVATPNGPSVEESPGPDTTGDAVAPPDSETSSALRTFSFVDPVCLFLLLALLSEWRD